MNTPAFVTQSSTCSPGGAGKRSVVKGILSARIVVLYDPSRLDGERGLGGQAGGVFR